MAKAVLVVDDNALIRQALCELFKREADFEVCGEAENGREAIEKAQQLHPDLIVMDLSMPVMNGIEAARVLKSLMPTVPLIIFSEYSDVFSEKEARSAGVSALVSKSEHASVLVGKARTRLPPRAQSQTTHLLCILCESLAFFAVKFFFTAKLAKNCHQERKAKPTYQVKLSLYLSLY